MAAVGRADSAAGRLAWGSPALRYVGPADEGGGRLAVSARFTGLRRFLGALYNATAAAP